MDKPTYQRVPLDATETDTEEQNRRILEWLERWLAEPDDLGPEWWDSFEQELKEHRLTLEN